MRKITYKRFELRAYITILIGLIFVSVKMYFPEYFDMHSKNKLFVVVSDSMDLTIAPHSSIIVDKSKDYIVVDDIITFKYDLNDDGYKEIITHRLHAIEDGIYKTMSDKYNQIDRWDIYESDIIGKVTLAIPYLGLIVLGLQRVTIPIMLVLLFLILAILAKSLIKWDKL